MEWIIKKKILIVGLGLIGGSYAKALTRFGYTVLAIDTDAEAIRFAKENGIIDEGATDADPKLIGEADCIIMALYPRIITDWIRDNQKYFKSGIRITDVTGIKSAVVYDIQAILRPDTEFIAAHPMAGRELSGVAYSDDRIFRDANYIVVPTDKNTPGSIEWCENLGRILGFNRVAVLSPEEHDEMIAFVSQLTHCIAVALMTCNDNEHLSEYTGDSFRDLTRIAKINDEMWSELFLANREKLLKEMENFKSSFEELETAIRRGDREKMREMMRLSTARRTEFDK